MIRKTLRWHPAVLGAMLGLLVGFAGGGATGLLSAGATSEAATARGPAPIAEINPLERPARRVVPKPAAPAAGGQSYVAALLRGPSKPSARCGTAGRLVRFRVIVESGLPTTPGRFASDVLKVLCDKRSWISSGKVRFQYDPNGTLLIGLRTPDSSERRCLALIHLSVNSYYSCASRSEVVLNSDRWFTGSQSWPGSVGAYRQMLVNHEVGHTLGQRHRNCPTDGSPAPVMMQQSKGMTNGDRTCTPNPWPLAYEKRSLG